ncbi:MAG: hypothetical protein IKP71_08755, partial [Candidatus Riflebacteria bacterium]|nr:hypothetical protein [Candidatus Riflebacteria bacterium]
KNILKNNLFKAFIASSIAITALLSPNSCSAAQQKLNYYYESKDLLNIKDPIGDDKGTGYYQYPLDKRLKRGTFDIKNFRVYEEGEVIVFEIQMRNYIIKTWEDTGKSDDQGFVANLWDIYIDIDGIEKSGYDEALPGRSVLFADKMGWEKAIIISPMNFSALEEILREKTDELEFQNRIDDIIIPDYVELQGDKVIVKISRKKLPRISEKSGFQCFSMGYKNVVSANRLLNRDVKAFPTHDDFGGGSNVYGDPTTIDIITPNNENQYKILKNFTAASYEDNIRYAEVPFVYANGNRISPAVEALRRAPMQQKPIAEVGKPPIDQPVVRQVQPQQSIPYMQPVNQTTVAPQTSNTNIQNGFVPLKKNNVQPVQQNRTNNSNIPSGFVPVKKNSNNR